MEIEENKKISESQETVPEKKEGVTPKGVRSIQGEEAEATSSEAEGIKLEPSPSSPKEDSSLGTNIDEEWKRTHDPSKWEYKLGSPHEEYQVYKDLEKAKRQHELGESAATAESLPDGVDTLLKGMNENKGAKETPMDQYMREKYGSHPYTTDAYPKNEEK